MQLQLPFPLGRARGVYGAPAAAAGTATATAAGCYLYGEEEEEERELRDPSRSGGARAYWRDGERGGSGSPRGRAMASAAARLWWTGLAERGNGPGACQGRGAQ